MADQLNRRRFLGYLIAAPTLAVAVGWTADLVRLQRAEAAAPSLPQPEEIFDLGDMQDLAAAPTSGLITVGVNSDGTASFAVPRAEVGQGMAGPPTINGTVVSVGNEQAVLAMPGVTDIAVLTHGVAIRADTFGQCIDAIGMIDVTWDPGAVAGQSDDTVEAQLNAALPDLTAPLPVIADSVDAEFFFAFASNSPLEPDSAIADVRSDSAEIWSSLKVPIVAQGEIAGALACP